MNFAKYGAAIALLCCSLGIQAHPVSQPAASVSQPITVGVKISPPFVEHNDKGYSGLAIDAWKKAAAEHGWTYQFKQYDLKGLLDAVASDQVDVGLGAITATAERERRMDFSHTLLSSGLGIAVVAGESGGWLALVRAFVSPTFLGVVITLLILLLIVGTLTWLFERRANAEQFGGPAHRGIGSGLWWAAVTMTTVGYGDKAPVTPGGRIIGLIWMFAGLIAVASFTAAITSALTVGQLSGRVRGASDLPHVKVVSIVNTTSASWLQRHHIKFRSVDSPKQALALLEAGKADAVVYDAPLLAYLIGKDDSGKLKLLPQTLARQDYVIIMPPQSPLRKPLNESVLKLLGNPEWQARWASLSGSSG